MGYVIQNCETGAYVTPSGSEKSYTRDVAQARVFSTKEGASRECCGNERVVPLESLFPARN
jgi:hypothetical protein